MNKELENKIYEIITHNDTSECQTKLVALFKQTLTSHTEELKKKIEGKRKEEHDENCLTNAPTVYFPEKSDYCDCRNPQFNQGIDAALSELNHE